MQEHLQKKETVQHLYDVRTLLDDAVGNAVTIAAVGVAAVLVAGRLTTAQKRFMRAMGITTVGVGLVIGVLACVDYIAFLSRLPSDQLPPYLSPWRLWGHVVAYIAVAAILVASGAFYLYVKVFAAVRK